MAEGKKIGAYGLTEPGSGSDAGGMKTIAKRWRPLCIKWIKNIYH